MIEEGEGLSLTIEGEGAEVLKAEPHNLVLKAAYALRAAAEKPELGAKLTLHKRIPLQAGLGGGSADAAAALRGSRPEPVPTEAPPRTAGSTGG